MSDNETGVIPPNESGGVSVTGTESSETTTPSEQDKATDISDDRTRGPVKTIRSNDVEVVSSSSINDLTADEGSTPSDADLYLNGTSHASFDPGVGTLHGSGQVDYGTRLSLTVLKFSSFWMGPRLRVSSWIWLTSMSAMRW